VAERLKRQLRVPFFMDIIILMSWSIWKTRNEWIFNGRDPTVDSCNEKFKKEFALVIPRAKEGKVQDMKAWLQHFN
jgi:hypothetical protein